MHLFHVIILFILFLRIYLIYLSIHSIIGILGRSLGGILVSSDLVIITILGGDERKWCRG